MASNPLSYNDYTVGWICALSEERTAATAMLDERHDSLPISNSSDTNSYTLGTIGKHNVVVVCLPEGEIGTNSAASVIMQLVTTFPSIKFGLLVGIGGGIPPRVRLGDIVVSKPVGEYPGVVQWDLGKATETGFVRTGSLDRPPKALLSALTTMKTNHEMEGHKISQFLEELAKKWPRLASKYTWNDKLKDTLFEAEHAKATNNAWQAIFATPWQTIVSLVGYFPGHKESELIRRTNHADTEVMGDERTPGDPKIHYGLIASGNQVIKDGSMRDEINARLGGQVLCVEMEAAGMMNNFPCLVIRGICDYADSKKNDHWHGYAAGIAAAFTKELLQIVRPVEIDGEPSARDVLNQVHQSLGYIKLKMGQEEEKQILDWLRPIDYGLLHSDYYKRLQPGTGEWLLERKEFQDWITGSNKTLFCHGIPGAGKTILASLVISHLSTRFRGNPDIGISYVYLSHNRQKDQDFQKLLASILKQLARGRYHLPESTKQLYNEHSKKRTQASFEEIITDLTCVITSYSKVFIILDALDESQFFDINLFLSKLFELQKEHQINILATSRPIPEVMDQFINPNIVQLQIRAETSDVTTYIEGHMDRLPKVARENPVLRDEIKADICEAADGMFLLVEIYLVLLEDKMTVNDIRKQLIIFKSRNAENNGDQKGKILAKAYEQAIERIKSQKEGIRNLAMRALAWVTFAKRQITTSELQHGLAAQDEITTISHDDLPGLTDITSACVGLLTIDKESRIIRLVHYTAHEYLEQTQDSWFPSAEESIFKSCLTYLLFEVFKSGYCQSDEALEHRLESFPLLHYAASHWDSHHSHNAESFDKMVQFLECQPSVEASLQARFSEKLHPLHQNYSQAFPPNLTGLHLAAALGLTCSTILLLERGYSPNAKDGFNSSPLLHASYCGYEAVAELLIMAGANLEAKDSNGYTALIRAAANGHEAVVKLLLEKGSDVNAQACDGRRPLDFAAFHPHKTIVEILRQRGGTSGAKDQVGILKLHHFDGVLHLNPASVGENENRDMTQNSKESHYEPPEIGSDIEIHQSRERDAGLNAKAEDSSTQLFHAAELGRHNIIQLLIEAGNVDLNEADDETGMTPLHWAAKKGHISVVELLVNAGAQLEIEQKENQLTALGFAVRHEQKDVCEFLLQRDASVHASNLYSAMIWGELAIIQQMVDRGVDINARMSDGETALFPAIKQGNFDAVRLLVEQGADINVKVKKGSTPLHWASVIGNIDIVRLLIERGADITARVNDYMTPLLSAIMYRNLDIVGLLIDRGADINAPYNGPTPLLSSILSGNIDMARLLVERGADINATSDGPTPLLSSIMCGNIDMARLLVDKGADINATSDSPTPLSYAVAYGKTDIARLLIEGGADINTRDKNGQTPLIMSINLRTPDITQLLMKVGADVNARDMNGNSTLFYAIWVDDISLITLMVEMDDVDFNTSNAEGITPIMLAKNHGKHHIVQLLLQSGKISNYDS